MPAPSLDGRCFHDVTPAPAGDVGDETRFHYHEDDDGTVRAEYSGGAVRLGLLVGRRDGDLLDFRYVHILHDRSSASGRCSSRVEALADGRLRLHESWQWESRPGSGSSVLDEVPSR